MNRPEFDETMPMLKMFFKDFKITAMGLFDVNISTLFSVSLKNIHLIKIAIK